MANALKTLFTECADAIRETLPDIGKMSPYSFPDNIREVAKAGSGGVDSDLVKYVTFMSEDGTEELFKMPVLNGDDCKDPIEHGDIGTPTKESTNTQHFSYTGWSASSGGSADANILKNVTEDKVVYVSFASSVRYYTVNFYDEDTTTLFKTVEVTYGANANSLYTPEKDGCIFSEWNPSVSNVTGNIDTYAVWVVDDGKITDDWATIVQNVANGNTSKYKVGHYRTLELNYEDGTSEELEVRIIGKDHDELADGSGKATLTFHCSQAPSGTKRYYEEAVDGKRFWVNSDLRTFLNNDIFNALPSDLRNGIKEVNKKAESTEDVYSLVTNVEKIWLLSMTEIGITPNGGLTSGQGTKYEYYVNSSTKTISSSSGYHWSRSVHRTHGCPWYHYMGTCPTSAGIEKSETLERHYPFGFCI